VSNLLAFFTLCATLTILIVGSRADLEDSDRQARDWVVRDSRRTTESLNTWLEDRERLVVHLAHLAATLPPAQMQARLDEARAADRNFVRIALLDRGASTIAFSPSHDELGRTNIGRSYADRPFLSTLARRLTPMLSEVVLSKVGRAEPVTVLMAPVVVRGAYHGLVGGVMNLDRIEAILRMNLRGQATRYTLLDKNGHVLLTNRDDQRTLGRFSHGRGTLTPVADALAHWVPDLPPNIATIELWGRSSYVAESTVGPLAEWRLLLEQPVAPFQAQLYARYIDRIGLLFLILIALLGGAECLSRRAAATLERLREATSNLPAKLASGAGTTWPFSGVQEIGALVANFQETAASLQNSVTEIRKLNDTLEVRIEERTSELQRSTETLANAADMARLGPWEYDVATDCFTFTDQFYRLFRTTAAEVGGYTLASAEYARRFVHPDDMPVVAREIRLAIEASAPDFSRSLEYRIRSADGTVGHSSVRYFIAKDPQGRTVKIYGVNQDITERKQAEDALRTHTQQLEALRAIGTEITRELELSRLLELVRRSVGELLETHHSVVYLWNEATELLEPATWDREREWLAGVQLRLGEGVAGAAAQRRTGMYVRDYPASPYLLPTFRAHNPPSEILAEPLLYRERLLGVLATDDQGRGAGFTPDDQEILRLFASQAAIAIENARLYEAARIELAGRRRTEEVLRRRSEQLEAVRSVSVEIARELDLHRLVTLIIQRAVDLLGAEHGVVWLWEEAAQSLSAHAWIGMGDWLAGHRLVSGQGVAGAIAQGRRGMIVNEFRTSPYITPEILGHSTYTAVVGEPLFYREKYIGSIVLGREPSGAPFSEEDLLLLSIFATYAAIAIENARLYTAAQQALADVQHAQAEMVRTEQLRGLGQLAAGIAHDLNNTLALVLGQLELAKHADPSPELQELLANIETAASDGAATVKRLQSFARPKGTSPLTPCDLGAIVREVVELARPRWQAEPQRRGVTVTVALDLPALPPIQGYAPELREALTNLIFNAVDAMPHGGTLTLAARVTDGQSGDEARGQLGEGTPALPSRRVAESPSRLPGGCVELRIGDTGIGMPPEIQAKIFEPFFTTKGVQGTGLGLAVVYGIVERHGGTIAVASALGQGTTFALTFQRATEAEAAPAPPAPAAPLLRSPRRLLVVDDEPGVRQTLARLLRHASHQVVEAPDGPAALALLATTPVDLVITDLGMPEMNGWELARRIQAARPGLPVILLTGWQDQAPEEAGDRAAVDAILGKPVQLPALLQAIRDLTETEDRAVLQ
jgi:signal transduction histidine kinase/ActR/RegA family two-component response regulator